MLDPWDIYVRSIEGKRQEESEFSNIILPTRLYELANEYDISFSPDEIVPSDPSYIKNVFNAAVDLLVDVGFYNESTGRIIAFEESEIKHHLRLLPGEYTMGEGNEKCQVVKRGFESKKLPPIIGGPCGAPISEEYYTPIMQSFAQEPCVRGLHTATLETINGSEIKSNTTAEMIAARREIEMTRDAVRRAGRPGLSITGTMSASSSEGQCFGHSPEGLRSSDRLLVSLLNDMKVNWDVLKKSLYCQYNNLGIANCMAPLLGGYLGGPETTAIGLTAECIASFLLLGGPCIYVTPPFDVSTGHQVFNEGFFAIGSMTAAMTQNTNALVHVYCGVSSGMCTERMIYETFAIGGTAVSAGSDAILGSISCDAIHENEYSGMNSRILDGASTAFAGMSLKEANEFVVEFIKMYGGDNPSTFKPELGKKFYECYDLRTNRPSKEFIDLWESTKTKINDMGLDVKE